MNTERTELARLLAAGAACLVAAGCAAPAGPSERAGVDPAPFALGCPPPDDEPEGDPEEGSPEPGPEPETPQPRPDDAERAPSPSLSGRAFTDSYSYIDDQVVSPDREAVPGVRPRPLLEIGDPFQGQGPVTDGFEIPTGAVWNPSLLVYGTFRSAFQVFDPGNGVDRSEWANRLDLFANLRLSATERILFGLRPLDNPDRAGIDRDGNPVGSFTGYELGRDGGRAGGWKERFDGTVQILFFEGDFGELFPGLDKGDDSPLDLGFTVGRQPILFQDGIMVNGILDAAGLVKNNLRFWGASNIRMAALYASPDVVDQLPQNRIDLVGFFNEVDTRISTLEIDGMYKNSRREAGSGLFFGLGATQRLGPINSTIRYNISIPLGQGPGEVPLGHLITLELAMDIPGTHDIIYVNGFAGIDEYESAFRGPEAGGPLGRIGILFAAPGIGRYGAPINPFPKRALGGVIGLQMFFNHERTQLIVEVGGRASTMDNDTTDTIGGAVRVQQALWNRVVLLSEGFVAKQERTDGDIGYGARFELILKF